jgi:hypothetical protein
MNKMLGKCRFCDDGKIEVRNITVDNKPVKLYACSNAHWSYEHDMAELTADSTCSFRIFQNSLLRWNKKAIGEREIRTLLKEEQVMVRLYSSQAKKEYYKWLVLDREYGCSILWDLFIDPDGRDVTKEDL